MSLRELGGGQHTTKQHSAQWLRASALVHNSLHGYDGQLMWTYGWATNKNAVCLLKRETQKHDKISFPSSSPCMMRDLFECVLEQVGTLYARA